MKYTNKTDKVLEDYLATRELQYLMPVSNESNVFESRNELDSFLEEEMKRLSAEMDRNSESICSHLSGILLN